MKKKISVITLVVMLMVSLTYNISKCWAQQSYPLVCRGGGEQMIFSYDPIPGSGGKARIMVKFIKGTQGVGNNYGILRPGECSWVDRGVTYDEPDTICQTIKWDQFVISWDGKGMNRGIGVSGGPTPYLHYLLNNPDGYFVFKVYNNRNGCFNITGFGP